MILLLEASVAGNLKLNSVVGALFLRQSLVGSMTWYSPIVRRHAAVCRDFFPFSCNCTWNNERRGSAEENERI